MFFSEQHFRKTNKVGVVCKSISIAAVIPACIIMLSYRSLRQQQRIRVHLCLLATSLMLAILTMMNELLVIQDMLHGENRDQTVLKRNPLWCGLLLLAIQYSYMALFMWMFIEFFHLHRLLVNAFSIPKSLVSYYITGFDSPLLSYCLFGFGFPFLMVSIVGIFRASNENLRKNDVNLWCIIIFEAILDKKKEKEHDVKGEEEEEEKEEEKKKEVEDEEGKKKEGEEEMEERKKRKIKRW
ncbi:calcitonin-like receptor [Plakobranchus ocellatus]|uniref:Calcitonin-like receptor n=1 Tax=Plakobranchus ocellatus TaxID=259542 RepID=A0AAV4DKW4_9GAST|nr:calcitonin-like receptor [Plakobranchus ocellatus]